MSKNGEGILIVVSGPSGVGKGSICRALQQRHADVCYAVSATTRQPRQGEQDGVAYYFISEKEFLRRRAAGEFLEWAENFGHYYGTLRSEVERLQQQGKNVILEIDTQGAMQIRSVCPSGVFVFILPPSLEELQRRISGRGSEPPEVQKVRLMHAQQEIEMAPMYDYQIVNDEVERAADQLMAVIRAEQLKRNIKKEKADC